MRLYPVGAILQTDRPSGYLYLAAGFFTCGHRCWYYIKFLGLYANMQAVNNNLLHGG